MSARPRPILISVDRTTKWARKAVAGELVVGEFVRLAAQRHLDDLENGHERGLSWDQAEADRAIDFFPAVLSITEGAKEGEPFNLLPWHLFVVGSIYGWRDKNGLRRFRFVWMETGKGQAKALSLDTPIPTPTGWTTMGALKDGDQVYGADGKQCRVLRAHPVVTGQDCYRLTFDDGSEVVANAGHLWATETRKSGSSDKGAAMRGVPLAGRGTWRNAVRTTEEIAKTLRYKNGQHMSANHSVTLCGPLHGADADLEIPAYALGAWLGDGDSDTPRITVCDGDVASLAASLAEDGIWLGKRGAGSGSTGRYMMKMKAKIRDGLGARIRRLGVFKNKHIPAVYLRAPERDRWRLLRGLMDTDGTVCARGQCSYSGTNRRLIDGVHELVLSLGLKATVVEARAKIYGKDCGPSWKVNFHAPPGARVFDLDRKQERVAPTHARRRLSGDRRIVACEKIPSVPVRCITVNSPDSLFLCGRGMIPTHNSPLMAGLGLYEAIGRGKSRVEVYCIGEDKDTAKVMFKDAVAMCRAPIPGKGDETLENSQRVIIRGTGDNAWKIEHPKSSSLFQPVANTDAISGPKPKLVLGDEIHEMKTSKGLQIWRAAIAKMSGDPMMVLGTNTPSVDQHVGTEYSEYFQKVLRKEFPDDSAFGFIARTDKGDDPMNDEGCWVKALPALGITYPIENVRKEVETSRNMISTALTTKRLFFGIPVGTAGFWIAEDAWERTQGVVDEAQMAGRKLHLAMDLSEKNDLTALSGCWEGDQLAVKTWYWTTGERVAERSTADQIPYREIEAEGQITITSTPIIDYSFVVRQVETLCAAHDVRQLVVDSTFIQNFMDAADRAGFACWMYKGPDEPEGVGLKIVPHAQGGKVVFEDKMLCMPLSMRHLEDAVLKGALVIDRNRVTTICASNAVVQSDAYKNKYFHKNRSRGRIDGMVTIAMSVGSAASSMDAQSGSYLEQEELVIL